MQISIMFSLKFRPKVLINNISALVQIMFWRRPADKPFSEPMLVIQLTHICTTRLQWVKAILICRLPWLVTHRRCCGLVPSARYEVPLKRFAHCTCFWINMTCWSDVELINLEGFRTLILIKCVYYLLFPLFIYYRVMQTLPSIWFFYMLMQFRDF